MTDEPTSSQPSWRERAECVQTAFEDVLSHACERGCAHCGVPISTTEPAVEFQHPSTIATPCEYQLQEAFDEVGREFGPDALEGDILDGIVKAIESFKDGARKDLDGRPLGPHLLEALGSKEHLDTLLEEVADVNAEDDVLELWYYLTVFLELRRLRAYLSGQLIHPSARRLLHALREECESFEFEDVTEPATSAISHPRHRVTVEQVEAATFEHRPGSIDIIRAYAGTGKTTTLIEAAARIRAQRGPGRILYASFNKALQESAKAAFNRYGLDHVGCRTFSSLSYRHVVMGNMDAERKFRGLDKKTKLYPKRVVELFGLSTRKPQRQTDPPHGRTLASRILASLKRFMISADPEPAARHIVEPRKPPACPVPKAVILDYVTRLWRRIIDYDDLEVPLTFDAYHKLGFGDDDFILRGYDWIFIDEAQDLNALDLSFFLRQKMAHVVMVGDVLQNVYGFRGANNGWEHLPSPPTSTRYLTSSFRFGPTIASAANVLIRARGQPKPIRGAGSDSKIFMLAEGLLPPGKLTVVCRSNRGIVAQAISETMQARPRKFYSTTAIPMSNTSSDSTPSGSSSGSSPLELYEDAYKLRRGQNRDWNSRHHLLKDFSTWQDLEDEVEEDPADEGNTELKALVQHAEMLDDDQCLVKLEQAKRLSVSRPECAELILTTVHKAKGQEWDRVALGPDFGEIFKYRDEWLGFVSTQEANILYVAATRAKKELHVNAELLAFLTLERGLHHFKPYDLDGSNPCARCQAVEGRGLGYGSIFPAANTTLPTSVASTASTPTASPSRRHNGSLSTPTTPARNWPATAARGLMTTPRTVRRERHQQPKLHQLATGMPCCLDCAEDSVYAPLREAAEFWSRINEPISPLPQQAAANQRVMSFAGLAGGMKQYSGAITATIWDEMKLESFWPPEPEPEYAVPKKRSLGELEGGGDDEAASDGSEGSAEGGTDVRATVS